MKTASVLSWVFPGMGHYYSGRTGKGMFFTALELGSLAGVYAFNSGYSEKQDAYATAQADLVAAQVAYNEFAAKVSAGETWTNAEKETVILNQANAVETQNKAFDDQTNAFNTLVGCGTIAAVVWVWNIWDVKKTSKNYSSNYPTSLGFNPQGQLTFTIKF